MAETTGAESKQRGRRKIVSGRVVSNKMQKTIVVRADRKTRHPEYGKFVRGHTTYYAHDEKNEAAVGDEVSIMETRPLSKLKRWRLIKVVKKASAV